jgi:NAD(P)-dependent dehydrogenase (short-subunit alcohol dehydrogenase family)
MSSAPPSSRVALVTGAAQGIGRAISLRLADDGFNVALNDLPSKSAELEALKAEIAEKGREAIVAPGDVSSEDDVISMVDTTVSRLGSLDVVCTALNHPLHVDSSLFLQMVANAGITFACPLTERQ